MTYATSTIVIPALCLACLLSMASPCHLQASDSHREGEALNFREADGDRINTIGMRADGRLLVSILRATGKHELLTTDDQGSIKQRLDLSTLFPLKKFNWEIMLHGPAEGGTVVGGCGKLVLLDNNNKAAKQCDYTTIFKENGDLRMGKKPVVPEQVRVAGITSSADHYFIAFSGGRGTRSWQDVWRLNKDFAEPKRIITGMRGCCAHLDLEVHGKELIIAENLRHRICVFDHDGKLLRKWGKKDPQSKADFTGCCNPVGLEIVGDTLVTASSGVGHIKRYSLQGTFGGMLGPIAVERWSGAKSTKCYIPIEASADGKRIYVLDIINEVVRVMNGSAL